MIMQIKLFLFHLLDAHFGNRLHIRLKFSTALIFFSKLIFLLRHNGKRALSSDASAPIALLIFFANCFQIAVHVFALNTSQAAQYCHQ